MSRQKSKMRLEMGEEKWSQYQKGRERNKKLKWYSNPQNKKKTTARVSIWRTTRKKELIDYKGGRCCKCGYSKDILGAYDFHHIDPSKKDFSISKKRYFNMETLKREVDKCELVCKNCHAELHATNQLKG